MGMVASTIGLYLRLNQLRRREAVAYKSLIATPAIGTFTLPASGEFVIKSLNAVSLGTQMLSVSGNTNLTFKSIAMNAGDTYRTCKLIQDSVAVISPGFEMYLDIGSGFLKLIAKG